MCVCVCVCVCHCASHAFIRLSISLALSLLFCLCPSQPDLMNALAHCMLEPVEFSRVVQYSCSLTYACGPKPSAFYFILFFIIITSKNLMQIGVLSCLKSTSRRLTHTLQYFTLPCIHLSFHASTHPIILKFYIIIYYFIYLLYFILRFHLYVIIILILTVLILMTYTVYDCTHTFL